MRQCIFCYLDDLTRKCIDWQEKTLIIRKKPHPLLKGTLSGLRQFLATESPLKLMKNAFYFTSKALFVLKIFKFLS